MGKKNRREEMMIYFIKAYIIPIFGYIYVFLKLIICNDRLNSYLKNFSYHFINNATFIYHKSLQLSYQLVYLFQ